jgi:polysaccharide export outer membrane protein
MKNKARFSPARAFGFFLAALLTALLLFAPGTTRAQQQLPAGLLPDVLQQQLQSGRQPAVPDVPATTQILPATNPTRPLPVSRLEQIMSQRAGATLRQFGYDTLGYGRSISVNQSSGVQDDYILGAGDEIVLSLRGTENSEARVLVNRDGQAVLPRLSPIPAAGRSFGSFRQDVEAAVQRSFVATNAFVSLGRVRQLSVLVSGEVGVPGQRTLNGLSSVVDALLLSGGVKKSGSLRNVRLQRNGRTFTIDLYSILTDRGSAPVMRLTDGDRIIVPLLGETAAVTGLVRRPGIYELAPGQSSIMLRNLMELAGGREVSGQYRLSLLQILPDGRSSLMALAGETGAVRASEILFVQLGADQAVNLATLGGATGLAGVMPITEGTRLSQWLRQPGAMGPSPYTLFGILVRKNPQTLLQSVTAFTPTAVLAGREDLQLQSDDFVRPLSVVEAQLLTFVTNTYLSRLASEQSALRNPLSSTARQQQSTDILTQLQTSGEGASLDDASGVPADTQRREVVTLLDLPLPGSDLARRQQQLRESEERSALLRRPAGSRQPASQSALQAGTTGARADGPADPQAEDPLAQERIIDDAAALQERISNGRSDLTSNYAQQTTATGRFVANREVETFGQLARQLNVDPLVLVNFLVDHRIRLEGAVKGPGYYFVGASATATDLVQAAGGTMSWVDETSVELISTMVDARSGKTLTNVSNLAPAMMTNYVLRSRDQLRFGRVAGDVGLGSVSIQGEVRKPGTIAIIRGERLSSVLARAGGLTNTAYPTGAVFLRRSVAQAEREGFNRAANEVQNQLVVAMTRIGNSKIDPATFASMQTFVTELRSQQALGRISIVADPSVLAANPALDPLMEPGDLVHIPARPSTIYVLGQVMQAGSYPYQPGMSLEDYVARAGGYGDTADSSQTFVILPDGSARRLERSWFRFGAATVLPPGSAIVVPRDVTPLDVRQTIIDVTQILSQLAVSIASVAVLSK